jgi:DNA polymerase-3 subunit beta
MSGSISEVLGEAGTADPFAGTPSPSGLSYESFSFVTRSHVLSALCERAASVVPARENLPVLRNFHVSVGPDRLSVRATDMELSVVATSPAVEAGSSHVAVLPARKLLAILKEVPDGEVGVAVSGDRAVVTAGSARWNLHLVDAPGDYPAMPDLSSAGLTKVSRDDLLKALRSVRHAVCRNGSLPMLMMVCIADGKVTACDNSRLAQASLAGFPDMQIPAGGSPSAVDELLRLLAGSAATEVSAGQTDSALVFTAGAYTLIAGKMPVQFPDVESQIMRPALTNAEQLSAGREELARAVRRVRINADPETSAIGLELGKDAITVVSRDKAGNTSDESVEASWAGGERTLVVNHQFLADLLAVWPSPQLTISLGKDKARRRSAVLARDAGSGLTAVLQQMAASLLK